MVVVVEEKLLEPFRRDQADVRWVVFVGVGEVNAHAPKDGGRGTREEKTRLPEKGSSVRK